jgi:sugar/nucleoside kinase (ribokinase family)
MHPDRLPDLAAHLTQASLAETSVLVGFDAFLDELTHIVDRRTGPDRYEQMGSLAEFGKWVSAAAGRSGSREAVVTRICAGGCALNLGDGLAALGVPVTACVGLGATPHVAFSSVLSRFAALLPFPAEPGRTTAYEFEDGKLMLCSVSHFVDVKPESLRIAFANGAYRRAAMQARALVFASWSVYPNMTACWRFLQNEVLAGLDHRPVICVDLADPASRAPEELVEMAEALAGFEHIGPVVLTLNYNEAGRLASALGIALPASSEDIAGLAGTLRRHMGLSEVSIHRLRDACLATASTGGIRIEGPYCSQPRQSVGAGDRFNAGLLAGRLLGLDPEARLIMATATAGFFVREARSPSWAELIHFIERWATGLPDTRGI